MIKRATWFAAGVAAGAAGTSYASRKIKTKAAQLTPAKVVKRTAARVRGRGRDLAEAVREGRNAMRAKEDELRSERDARSVAQNRGQVIILSDVRELERVARQISPQHPASRPRRSRR
jgi:Sec-independent protein translocase protein TatA